MRKNNTEDEKKGQCDDADERAFARARNFSRICLIVTGLAMAAVTINLLSVLIEGDGNPFAWIAFAAISVLFACNVVLTVTNNINMREFRKQKEAEREAMQKIIDKITDEAASREASNESGSNESGSDGEANN